MIQINCVGVGHWGPNLVRNFATASETEVRTVCDLSQDRLRLVRSRIPGVRNFSTDPDATVTDPDADAIVIATPVSSHFELTKKALETGKHVLVEKPLCQTTDEGVELIELAEKMNKLLCVGHVFLFNNGIRGMRNLIRSGELGRIRYLYAVRTNLGPVRDDVDALWDLGSHDLSIFNYLLDAEPTSVTAHGACYLNHGIHDVVTAGFVYPDNQLAYLHTSWLNPRKVREITLVGDHKMAVWNDMDLNEPLRIYDKSLAVNREPVYSDSFGSFRMFVNNGDVVIPSIRGPEPLAAQCDHFVDCIQGRAEPINDAAVALRVIRALEAASDSIKQGSTCVVTEDNGTKEPVAQVCGARLTVAK